MVPGLSRQGTILQMQKMQPCAPSRRGGNPPQTVREGSGGSPASQHPSLAQFLRLECPLAGSGYLGPGMDQDEEHGLGSGGGGLLKGQPSCHLMRAGEQSLRGVGKVRVANGVGSGSLI